MAIGLSTGRASIVNGTALLIMPVFTTTTEYEPHAAVRGIVNVALVSPQLTVAGNSMPLAPPSRITFLLMGSLVPKLVPVTVILSPARPVDFDMPVMTGVGPVTLNAVDIVEVLRPTLFFTDTAYVPGITCGTLNVADVSLQDVTRAGTVVLKYTALDES